MPTNDTTTPTSVRKTPPAPSDLGAEGRRFWREVHKNYALRVDETVVLASACRVIDLVQHLDEAMASQPLVVKGSMGQERENPLLSEARLQRMSLVKMLAQLNLPDEDAGLQMNQHRSAAQSRWAAAHGASS